MLDLAFEFGPLKDARAAYEQALDPFEREGNAVAADRVRERMRC